MSEVKEENVAQEPSSMQQGTADYLNHVLGGINDTNPSPALEELKNKISTPQEAPPAEAPKDGNGLLNSSMNANGNPEAPKEPVATSEEKPEANQNELVNDLNGDLEGSGPKDLIDNPLMKIQTGEPKKEENPLASLEGIDKVNEFLSSKIEGVKSVDEVVSKYAEMQGAVEESTEIKGKYETLMSGLRSLPPELVKAIELAESGQDYRSYISNVPSLDFNKEATDLDTKDLIKAYYGDKVSDVDFEAADKNSDEYDPSTEKYINTLKDHAVEKFNSDKKSFNSKTEQYLSSKQEKKEAYSNSVKTSLSSVREFFPDATDSYLSNVEDQLLKNGIDSLFKDENGNLKADAAARFVRASDDGGNLVTQLQRIAYDKAQTEANLEVLTRSQRTAPESGGTAQKQDVNQEKVKEHINNLVGGINTGSTY